MKELLSVVLELEEWNRGGTCDFCSRFENSENQSVCQIRTRSKVAEELIANDCACQKCKEKFENNELPKCKRCKRLETKLSRDTRCDCIRDNEDVEEKELPILPHEGSPYAFYERQINALQEEKNQLIVEAKTHLDAIEAFEVYNKKHRQQLLDKIKELETEVERLKKQTPQELVKEIEELKEQVEQLTNQQQAQIEVKVEKKFRFPFTKK